MLKGVNHYNVVLASKKKKLPHRVSESRLNAKSEGEYRVLNGNRDHEIGSVTRGQNPLIQQECFA